MDWEKRVIQLVDVRYRQWLQAMVAAGEMPASVLEVRPVHPMVDPPLVGAETEQRRVQAAVGAWKPPVDRHRQERKEASIKS